MSDEASSLGPNVTLLPSVRANMEARSDAPLIWQPTPVLRWFTRTIAYADGYSTRDKLETVLQQSWFGTNGVRAEQEWRDVPVESETENESPAA